MFARWSSDCSAPLATTDVVGREGEGSEVDCDAIYSASRDKAERQRGHSWFHLDHNASSSIWDFSSCIPNWLRSRSSVISISVHPESPKQCNIAKRMRELVSSQSIFWLSCAAEAETNREGRGVVRYRRQFLPAAAGLKVTCCSFLLQEKSKKAMGMP